ncbi:unnamed protein product [Ectocarpus sp. 12 AP-2014]
MAASPSTGNTATGTAFPYRSVVVLALVLTTNGYTLTNLFPYVGTMTKHLLGLSTTNESGYYAGYVASSFTFGRFLTAYVWGNAADTIGRKPVVIVGLSSIIACSVVFGLSTSFAMAVGSRFVLGLTNGIMPAVRTMTREVCGPEHVVSGMNYIAGSKGVGLVMGTAVGGLLAQPASTYPAVFSASGVFARYPFLLPNLVGAGFALVMLALVVVFLPETRTSNKAHAQAAPRREASPASSAISVARRKLRKSSRNQLQYKPLEDNEDADSEQRKSAVSNFRSTKYRDAASPTGTELVPQGKRGRMTTNRYEPLNDDGERGIQNDRTDISCSGEGQGEDVPGPSRAEEVEPGMCEAGGLLSTPNVKMVIFIAAMVQMLSIGFDEVYPLWAVSTTDVGGMGWAPAQIGKVLVVTGTLLAICTLGIYPRLIKMMGIVMWQRIGCLLGIPIFLAVPNAKFVSWNESSLFVVSALTNFLAFYSISTIMLPLTVASTTMVPQHQRGKLSGLFMTSESLGRFVGPASYSNIFAWSISPPAQGWVDYRFVFYISAGVMAAISALGWKIFNSEALAEPVGPGGSGDESGSGPAAVAGEDGAAGPVKQALMSSPGGSEGSARRKTESFEAVGASRTTEQEDGTSEAFV